MATQKETTKYLQALRKRAEAELKKREDQLPEMSGEQIQNLIQELHTHQIELELQNEELRIAQESLAEEHAKYVALYDFAPVGYFTLNDEGVILDANLTGAELLGVARSSLKKKPFTSFISHDDQDIYYRHRQKLLDTREPQSCELSIKTKNGPAFWALIECVSTESEDTASRIQFNMTLTDISQKKRDEDTLKNTVHELNRFNQFMVNREIRMIELKKRINGLQERLGEEKEFPE